MNYRFFFLVCFSFLGIGSIAQSPYGIRRVDAFFTERMPGIIRADDNDKEVPFRPDTITTIYIEFSGTPVKWITAWKDGRTYSIMATAINERPVDIGVNKHTNAKIVLRPAGRNSLWLLHLSGTVVTKPPVKPRPGEIILLGRQGKKTITYRIGSQVELESIPSV